MELESVDHGRMALAELQALILRAREIAFNGGDVEVLHQEAAEELESALFRLDQYLTGKTDGRREDKHYFFELIVNNRTFLVHLSDGGYSRLTITFEDGNPVVLDRSLSREPVKKKWAALFPPS